MSIFSKLQDLASTSVDISKRTNEIFPRFNADHTKKSRKLLEQGKENGLANLPNKDATSQDSIELTIKGDVEEARDRYHRDYHNQIQAYSSRVTEYSSVLDVRVIKADFDEKLSNIETDYRNRSSSLFAEAEQLQGRAVHVKTFRKDNLLSHRLPIHPDSKYKAGMVIAVLALAELALNFMLLRESGDVMSVAVQALLYGFINVIVPFLIFASVFRYVNHANPTYAVFGYVSIVVYIIYTLFINLLIAHYRGVSLELAVEIGQATEFNQGLLDRYLETASVAFSNFKSDWFGLKDIWAWFLFLGGCGLSIAAVREGYVSDDPYPGYRKLYDTYKTEQDDFLDASEELTESLQNERERAAAELKAAITNLRRSFTALSHMEQTAEELKTRCETALDSLDTAYNMLLKTYREENVRNRTEPSPSYFQEEYQLDRPNLKSLKVGELQEPTDVIIEIESYSDILHKRYNEMLAELQSMQDVIEDRASKLQQEQW